ncbi:ABC transporter permease subunit [Paracoccus benzoatiresistens]|uniref:ABC transporter permease subunit n=1 Tax=Paracoccus benzoatiresistens TaxID=2997341 RepID=A0ABT4JAM8_9RHOB|nr:ABC transporter permease subunit [Paracoccus sp. EF6]MCZ0963398.1 ABC transporter permease subunit [Paracoccus sp. EF6]
MLRILGPVSPGRPSAFTLGGIIGFVLGILVGFSRLAEALLDCSIQMIRAIPFLALLPLVIIWFGVDESGKIFLVSLAVLFSIYTNTVLGIRQVDPKLLELARVTGLSRLETIRRIILIHAAIGVGADLLAPRARERRLLGWHPNCASGARK